MPRQPVHRLPGGHDVWTAARLGRAELSNGALLGAAERAGFEVVVTGERRIPHQQVLEGRRLGLVVVSTNDRPTIRGHLDAVAAGVAAARAGTATGVTLLDRRGRADPRLIGDGLLTEEAGVLGRGGATTASAGPPRDGDGT